MGAGLQSQVSVAAAVANPAFLIETACVNVQRMWSNVGWNSMSATSVEGLADKVLVLEGPHKSV